MIQAGGIRKLSVLQQCCLPGCFKQESGISKPPPTVSFHNFKSQKFKLSVSNPKSKYGAYLSVLSQISNCQGLGRKNKHEVLKTDRMNSPLRKSRQMAAARRRPPPGRRANRTPGLHNKIPA